MDIKDIIHKRRLELGLTYEQLGDIVGVGKSTVRKWETGMIENMRRDSIVALSNALDISPALIMGWEEKEAKRPNKLETIAAHFEGDEFTEDDKDDIENFIKYVLSKKNK